MTRPLASKTRQEASALHPLAARHEAALNVVDLFADQMRAYDAVIAAVGDISAAGRALLKDAVEHFEAVVAFNDAVLS